jgi:hypothetical protein
VREAVCGEEAERTPLDPRQSRRPRGVAMNVYESPGPGLRYVRLLLAVFVAGLVLSGLTAFPLAWESRVLASCFGEGTAVGAAFPGLAHWLSYVREGLETAGRDYPFLAYGTDWLAFAHLVIAVAFWGPLRDPVKNLWVVEFGMIACLLVIPLALICGPLRGIPLYWQLLDCSFGVFGLVPLAMARRLILSAADPDRGR